MKTNQGESSPELLTVELFSAIEATTYTALLRRLGPDALDKLANQLLGQHMAAHFVDGLEKLGIPESTSDAQKCALYHVLSNELGGYRVGYIPETSDKAWIFYHVPYRDAHPWMGTGYSAMRPSFWINQMRAWHAYDGEAIGNKGIAFVGTHFVSLGDPYDAGYFIDRHRDLQQSERLTFNLGETPRSDLKIEWPKCGEPLWPAEHSVKAHRNYARSYASAIMLAVAQQAPQEARDLIEFVLRTVLFALEGTLDSIPARHDAQSSHIERVAGVIAHIERAAGAKEVTLRASRPGALITITVNPGSAFFAADEWNGVSSDVRQLVATAISRAWSYWASYIAPGLRVSLSADAGAWQVEQITADGIQAAFGVGRDASEATLLAVR